MLKATAAPSLPSPSVADAPRRGKKDGAAYRTDGALPGIEAMSASDPLRSFECVNSAGEYGVEYGRPAARSGQSGLRWDVSPIAVFLMVRNWNMGGSISVRRSPNDDSLDQTPQWNLERGTAGVVRRRRNLGPKNNTDLSGRGWRYSRGTRLARAEVLSRAW